MHRPVRCAIALALVATTAGCASFRPLPLPSAPDLAPNLLDLDTSVPPTAPQPQPVAIDLRAPLSLDAIGWLALLNDPALRSQWGEAAFAQASLLQATLLPNPSVSLGFAALLGGPGSTPAYTASLSQDITALVTYHARVRSAQAELSQVNAGLLWQEWQVAQKARLLSLDIYWTSRSIAVTRHERDLLSDELAQAQTATLAGNLALSALAPLLAAQAAAQQSLVALNLARLQDWQALDALLGLEPSVQFAIAPPVLHPLPAALAPLIAALPHTRPDLVALRLGYRAAEESLRAAILGQFPAFVLGGSWGSDTTDVQSAGPNVTFDLPVFNRNQGQIAQSRATRLVLREQYLSRLDSAVGAIRGLGAQKRRLSDDLTRAQRAASAADRIAASARAAYGDGNLDQRSLVDYETTALQRRLEVIVLHRMIDEDRITLGVELGIGLPSARIAPPDRMALQ